MGKILPVHEGDLVALRKPHACGANCWLVAQLGADVRLVCQQCGRRVLMPRDEFDRRLKKRWSSKAERDE